MEWVLAEKNNKYLNKYSRLLCIGKFMSSCNKLIVKKSQPRSERHPRHFQNILDVELLLLSLQIYLLFHFECVRI